MNPKNHPDYNPLAIAADLCRWLADEAMQALDTEEQPLVVLETLTDDNLLRLEICDRDDGGTCPWQRFEVVRNCNPSGDTAFAVLQTEPDSGDRWTHLSQTVCF